jgi:hypothetical protein
MTAILFSCINDGCGQMHRLLHRRTIASRYLWRQQWQDVCHDQRRRLIRTTEKWRAAHAARFQRSSAEGFFADGLKHRSMRTAEATHIHRCFMAGTPLWIARHGEWAVGKTHRLCTCRLAVRSMGSSSALWRIAGGEHVTDCESHKGSDRGE